MGGNSVAEGKSWNHPIYIVVYKAKTHSSRLKRCPDFKGIQQQLSNDVERNCHRETVRWPLALDHFDGHLVYG